MGNNSSVNMKKVTNGIKIKIINLSRVYIKNFPFFQEKIEFELWITLTWKSEKERS